MTLQKLATKLRQAADVLDDLLGIERVTINETSKTADKIRASFKKRKYTKRKKLHWTQRPENRAKILRVTSKNLKKARRVKRAMLKAVA